MKVILLERVGKLGTIGDEVNVRPGFARNFLLPEGKALRANDANRAHFEAQRVDIEKRNDERKTAAGGISDTVGGKTFVMIRQAGETGILYGSVTARDIVESLHEDGTEIVRSMVKLQTPIKAIGMHDVKIQLHAEVDTVISVNVARSDDEAKRQAAGEDLSVRNYNDDDDEDIGEISTDFVDAIILIDGIGEKTAESLEGVGITKLTQLIELSEDDLTELAEKLGLGDQIATQEWIDQAAEMIAGGEPRADVDKEIAEKMRAANAEPEASEEPAAEEPVAEKAGDESESTDDA